MPVRPTLSTLVLLLALASPAAAQSDGSGSGDEGSDGSPNPLDTATEAAGALASGDLGAAASAAAEAIRGAAEDRLLIADVIGAEVTGPDGASLGTVENLVAVPGGKLVAAVLAVEGGERLPVPYELVKVSSAADTLGISLPVGLEELRADEAVAALAGALDL